MAIDPSTGETVSVVVANASDLATLHFANLQEGAYVVGTGNKKKKENSGCIHLYAGSTGVAATMLAFGAVYFVVMTGASLA